MNKTKTTHKELGEQLGNPARRSVLVTLIAVPVFALAVIHALNQFNIHNPNRLADWLFWGKWHVLEQATEPVDWLILGDSSAAYSIERETFLKETGDTALNLGTVADSLTINDAWMLQRYIERFGPPNKGVIFLRTIRSWPKIPTDSVFTSLPLEFGYWNRFEPKIEFDPGQIFQFVLNRTLPVFNNPAAFQKLLRPHHRKLDQAAEFQGDGFIRYTDHRPRLLAQSLRTQIKAFRRIQTVLFSDYNRAGVRQITRLAEKHDFHFYWANPPLYKQLYKAPIFRRNFKRISGLITNLSSQSENIHRLMAKPMVFLAKDMQNPDHLIHSAAKRYTEALVGELNSYN